MKYKNTLNLLASLLFVIVALSAAPAAQGHDRCSTAKAAGDWGFTLTGTLFLQVPNAPAGTLGPVPGAAIGRLSVDADGKISGTEARNVGGFFANETISGSWTVNSDCTANIVAKIYLNGTLVRISALSAVFVNNSTKIRAVQESLTNPDGSTVPVVITLDGNKLSREDGD